MKLIFCLVVLGSLISPVRQGFAYEIDLATFLTSALIHSPEIKQSELQLNEALQKAEVANQVFDLSLNIDTKLIHKDDFQTAIIARTSLSGPFGIQANLDAIKQETSQVQFQVIYPLFQSKASLPYHQVRYNSQQLIAQQEISLLDSQKQVLLKAAEHFFNLWYNQEVIKSLQARINWATDQIELFNTMITKEAVTELDLLNGKLILEELKVELNIMANQDALLRKTVQELYGIPETIELIIEPQQWQNFEANQIISLPEEPLTEKLAKMGYELALNDLEQVQAEQGLKGQLQLNISQDKNWQIELAMNLPLFDTGEAKHKLIEVESQVVQAKNALKQAFFSNERLVAQYDLLVSQALSQLLLARERMALAQEQEKDINKRNAIGVASFEERYINVERVQATYISLIEAKVNFYLSLLQRQLI